MGTTKHLEKIEQLFEKSPVVSFRSIERIIGKGLKSSYAKLLVRNLIKKKKIISLAKGFYTKHNDIGLCVFCYKPSYLGLQTALSFHRVWEQETIPIIITTNKVRVGIRKIGENNLQIRKIDKKYFFGWNLEKEGQYFLPYSDLEKTFIDMVVFRQDMTNESIEQINSKIDYEKLMRYLKNYSQKTQKNVLLKLAKSKKTKFI